MPDASHPIGRGLSPVDILVLAGGINRIPLHPGHRPGYKALLTFGGRNSLGRVLGALEEVPGQGRRIVVGPQELAGLLPETGHWELLPGGDTVLESLFTGLERLRDAPAVLCVTADLPLLTPRAVEDFLDRCADGSPSAGIAMAMVPEEAFDGPFASAEKGFNRFRDVAVCHGNLFLLRPGALFASSFDAFLERLYRARKSSVRAALVLGLRVGLAYLVGVRLLRRLTLEEMAGIVSRRLGLEVAPVLLPHPEAALDVDEPEDYALVREMLGA